MNCWLPIHWRSLNSLLPHRSTQLTGHTADMMSSLRRWKITQGFFFVTAALGGDPSSPKSHQGTRCRRWNNVYRSRFSLVENMVLIAPKHLWGLFWSSDGAQCCLLCVCISHVWLSTFLGWNECCLTHLNSVQQKADVSCLSRFREIEWSLQMKMTKIDTGCEKPFLWSLFCLKIKGLPTLKIQIAHLPQFHC